METRQLPKSCAGKGATRMHWTLWIIPLFVVLVVPRNGKK